jgi:2-haloacid dehalogenase
MLCVFDVNETLVDLAALDDFFAEVTGTPAARREWFDLTIHTALTVTSTRGYRQFGEIAAACLPVIALRHRRSATIEHQDELGARIRSLPAHPDARPAIERLHNAGFAVVTLTNSTAAVAEDQLRAAGLRDLIDAVYSADEVRQLKPSREPYQHVLAGEGRVPTDAVLIAAHDWDITGAAVAGLHTAFVARDGRTPLPGQLPPSITGTDLATITDQLIAQHAATKT